MAHSQYIVTKFGGKSVSELQCWQTIEKVTRDHLKAGLRPLIVCSAVSGITDLLEQLLVQSISGQYEPVLEKIRAKHQILADALQVPMTLIEADLNELERIAMGVHLLCEASPRTRAQILGFGERLSTKLGAAFLKARGLDIAWLDSRELLISEPDPHASAETLYLSARCSFDTDKTLIEKLNALPQPVLITQGFVAANNKGETVVLGRGGSDTSGAYFAAKLKAAKCEIWTDVPGIYTANPHQVPGAKILHMLDYDEAQEIASMGAKVLHPRAISPVQHQGIPLYIANTFDPDHPGTLITAEVAGSDHQIKAILTRLGLMLISIETLDMWQQVGFLSDISTCFKNHGLSIDLISTSETNITVSFDLKASGQDVKAIDPLLKELNRFCKATAIGPCASISLVGRNIRAIFHKLGDAFALFEEQQIYLISQAANDLNLSFVVDEDQVERLIRELHQLLVGNVDLDQTSDIQNRWWAPKQKQLLKLAQEESPLYVYDEETLNTSVQKLKSLSAVNRIFYAMKANNYPAILKQFYQAGLGFECVSLTEVEFILELFPEIDRKRIIFTPNFAPKAEYQSALELGVNLTIDSLYPLEHWPELFKGKSIIARIDPGQGYGHHRYVCTAGNISKFGIPLSKLTKLKQLAAEHHVEIKGLHAHTGSGILDPEIWQQTAVFLTNLAAEFPNLSFINIGGGLGIPEKLSQQGLDFSRLNELLKEVKATCPKLEFWMEPGRFLVAQAGILLAKVTQIKTKEDQRFVGINTGMNSLIRPALYGAYHFIANLNHLDEAATETANIVGPICESGDTLGFSRLLPPTQEGDILLIDNAGAYGHVMSSNYNMRAPAKEYYLK